MNEPDDPLGWLADQLAVERDHGRRKLLAEGTPAWVVDKLLRAAEEMHDAALAQMERDIAAAVDCPPSIH